MRLATLDLLLALRGWSARQLGVRAGVPETSISHSRNGRRVATSDEKRKLARALGVAPGAVVDATQARELRERIDRVLAA